LVFPKTSIQAQAFNPEPYKFKTIKENKGLPWLRGHWHQAENQDLRLWVQSPDCKKIIKSPSVRVMIICSDHKDTIKGRALHINIG